MKRRDLSGSQSFWKFPFRTPRKEEFPLQKNGPFQNAEVFLEK